MDGPGPACPRMLKFASLAVILTWLPLCFGWSFLSYLTNKNQVTGYSQSDVCNQYNLKNLDARNISQFIEHGFPEDKKESKDQDSKLSDLVVENRKRAELWTQKSAQVNQTER